MKVRIFDTEGNMTIITGTHIFFEFEEDKGAVHSGWPPAYLKNILEKELKKTPPKPDQE